MFVLVLCDFARCATISGPVITLNHNTNPSQGNCPNNSYVITLSDTAYNNMLFVHGMNVCPSGYSRIKLNGVTIGTATTTFTHNTTSSGTCRNGYKQIPLLVNTTFSKYYNKNCVDGTAYTYRPDNPPEIVPAYDGVIFGTQIQTCENGYLNNGTCVSYQQGNCPDNYQGMAINANTIIALNNGNCNSGYTKIEIESPCQGAATTSSTCMKLCESGYAYTANGTCENIQCPYGGGVFESGVGRNYQMYSGKQTTPTITARVGSGKCYINLAPGAATGNAINIRMNGTTYHLTD